MVTFIGFCRGFVATGLQLIQQKEKKRFRKLANHFLLEGQASVYNQAIMDFGALICTPRAPLCNNCPVALNCLALKDGMVAELPLKSRKQRQTSRYMTFVEVYSRNKGWLLHKRVAKDIWRGLYEPILMESNERLTFDEVANSESLSLFQVGSLSSLRCVAKRVKHVLTHRIIWADYYILESDSDYCPEDFFLYKKHRFVCRSGITKTVTCFFEIAWMNYLFA